MIKILGPYQSPHGTWWYDIDQDGEIKYGSLRTKNETIAKAKVAEMNARLTLSQKKSPRRLGRGARKRADRRER